MTEKETNKLKEIKNKAPTQPKKVETKNKCAYDCECKQCERCSKCDYTVNGLRSFHWRGNKLFCEFCLQDQQKDKKLITLKGITTSKVWERKKLSDTPAYCFLKTDERDEDIPVIFRIKYEKDSCQFHSECTWYCNEKGSWIKPTIRKGSCLQVQGYFTNSDKERKSFTAYSYQLLNRETQQEVLISHE